MNWWRSVVVMSVAAFVSGVVQEILEMPRITVWQRVLVMAPVSVAWAVEEWNS